MSLPKPALPGMHQTENAGAAVAALRALGEGLPEEAVHTRAWPARMQRLRRGSLAAQALAADMSMRMPVRSLAMVVAMMESKDVEEFWEPFGGLAAFGWTVPLEENGVAPEELARVANLTGIQCKPAESVEEAVGEVAQTMPDARVLICGSLYLAGEVLRWERLV